MESSSEEDSYKPSNTARNVASNTPERNTNIISAEEDDNSSDCRIESSSSDEDDFAPVFPKKHLKENTGPNDFEKTNITGTEESLISLLKNKAVENLRDSNEEPGMERSFPKLNKASNEDKLDSEAMERKLNVTSMGESSLNSFSTETGKNNVDPSDGKMKFLSSKFFQEFVCHPSTSKDNPEIIRTNDPVKEGEEASSRNINLGSVESDKGSSSCKFRTNVQKQEEKTDPKNASSQEPKRNVPFEHYSQPFNFVQFDKKTYSSSEEYFSDLRLWLQQAFFWQSVTAAFPYFLMCQQFGNTSSNQQGLPGFNFPPQFTMPVPSFQGVNQANIPANNPSAQSNQAASRQVIDGVECRVPSFWKRIVAEFIDFMILFFVKIAVTYVAIEYFQIIDLDQIEVIPKDSKMAYKQLVQITQEVVILELIHRLVVCVFETFWLRGPYNGQIGSATPGKNIMGLRVLYCDSSVFVRENEGVILVRPGTNLSLSTALFRSMAKNFVLALLVPTSFAFIFFPHNRTGYDMICNTIVVEEPIVPHRTN